MITMEQRALFSAIAFALLLMACSEHSDLIVAHSPNEASTIHAADRSVDGQQRPVNTVELQDIISWLAYSLLSTVGSEDAPGIAASAPPTAGDQRTDGSDNRDDGSANADPWALRDRAALRSPALPKALDPRQ